VRRRGIAVAICASGNYVGGAIWPSLIEHFVQTAGWRATFQGMGLFCLLTMLPLALVLRRRPPPQAIPVPPAGAPTAGGVALPFGLRPGTAQFLMCVAGVACCVAMSMPQVHIVAYCGDLGYGVAQGAQMLSVMLAFGVVSRLVFGLISDRIGGMRTVLISSTLQMVALLIYLPFDSLASLYVASALFGLFQGGIIPAYAIVIREQFPPQEAGTRVGLTLTATMVGMALGGWLSGAIFDLTGSYHAAFAHGAAWNLLNVIIMAWLFRRTLGPRRPSASLTPETAR
jgi:MFS family permease